MPSSDLFELISNIRSTLPSDEEIIPFSPTAVILTYTELNAKVHAPDWSPSLSDALALLEASVRLHQCAEDNHRDPLECNIYHQSSLQARLFLISTIQALL